MYTDELELEKTENKPIDRSISQSCKCPEIAKGDVKAKNDDTKYQTQSQSPSTIVASQRLHNTLVSKGDQKTL